MKKSKARIVSGVAAGIAEYQNVNPLIVRVLWLAGLLLSGGIVIVAYVIMAFLMPPPDDFDLNKFREQ